MADFLLRIIYVVIVFCILYIFYRFVVSKINTKLTKQQRSAMRKVYRLGFFFLFLMGLTIILGYDVSNLWLTLGSVAGLVAIGFIAVWSMLSNIVASMILFITRPFMIDQKLKVGDFEGIVVEITLFYTIIEDKDGNLVHFPNNMFFQKEFIHMKYERKTKKVRSQKKK